MSIIRAKKDERYSSISNEVLQRTDISARAKGLYAYFMTLPSDWKVIKSELHKHFKEGRDAINSAFDELENAGYISKQVCVVDGLLNGWDYTLYETLEVAKNDQNPSYGKPVLLKTRNTEKPSLLSTNIQSTNIQREVDCEMQPQHTQKTEKKLSYKQYTEQQFIDECNGQAILDSSERQKFISYWSEKSASGKMRFQMQQTWETSRRMATWKSRNNSFVAKSSSQAKPFSAPDADERYKGL